MTYWPNCTLGLRPLEDESAITRLIMSYGPAADAGLTSFAGQLWLEDGVYDWDANGTPQHGSAGVDAMLRSDGHQNLIGAGVAHFAGPLLIDLDGNAGHCPQLFARHEKGR